MTSQVVQHFFDRDTSTITYVVFDEQTKDAVVIDTVWNFNANSGALSTKSLDEVRDFIRSKALKVHLILETHAHADHLSGAQTLKSHFPAARIGIGRHITKVQNVFKNIYNLDASFPIDGRQFDLLLSEGEIYQAGSLSFRVLHTPGHTPACSSYLFDNCVFVGDALFMPDLGTGRCDFPEGSAKDLYDSVQKLFQLPEETFVFVGHDYPKGDSAPRFATTIKAEKAENIQIGNGKTRADFTALRESRDKTLDAPKLMYQSIQVNIAAGTLPATESNGKRYLKFPLSGD